MTVVDLVLLSECQNSADVWEAPSALITFLLHRGSHHADFVANYSLAYVSSGTPWVCISKV